MLPVQFRLRENREFQAVFAKGKSHANALLVVYVLSGESDRVRFGFSVSRKVGGSVIRNRVKRLLREAVRKLLPELAPGFDAVVVARVRARDAAFGEIAEALDRLLARLNVKPRSEA